MTKICVLILSVSSHRAERVALSWIQASGMNLKSSDMKMGLFK
jgi:hypothetical protein